MLFQSWSVNASLEQRDEWKQSKSEKKKKE